jgi:hypothetical protein
MARSAINDRLLRCIIYSGRESAAGQNEPSKHVCDGGRFRRNRPWYPRRHEHTTTISGRPGDDPRQYARQRRAVARGVVLGVPPSDDHEADPWLDDVPVPSFGPRMVCTRCGIIGADARPNWRR